MCGIAGLIGIAPDVARPAAERMLERLRHRGPDDEGLEVVAGPEGRAPAVLVHTRLSIVDLSRAGHQPKSDAPGSGGGRPSWITYNGEIYNFRELWTDLERAGVPCTSRSDTEVILKAYRAFGVRAVERFEGMFAFCLVDPERGLVWLCRDRIGIKPLYFFQPAGGGLIFASEVRALLAAGPDLVPARAHRGAIESFLAQGAVMSDASIVPGVKMLPPGNSMTFDWEGRPKSSVRYWAVAFGDGAGAETRAADTGSPLSGPGEAPARHRSEVVGEFGNALRQSMSKLLLADVPVGLFLSSGVDSTALAYTASRVSPNGLRTIAIGFDVARLDETEQAALTAREVGAEHQRVEVSGAEVLASFDDVLAAMDQPTVDGFNTYFVSRAARRAGLTVALSGLGGDELFGGYATFTDVPRAFHWASLANRRFGMFGRTALRTALSSVGRRLNTHGRALHKASESLRRPIDLVALYYLRRELFAPAERRSLHELPTESDPDSGVEFDVLDELGTSHRDRDALDRVAFLEFSSYMRHMLLRDSDVFGMANALEIRVPLLEHYAVEQAARAPGAWRRRDPRPKPLLIDAAGPLPARIAAGKKRGFTFPWDAWLRGPLRERARQALGDAAWGSVGIDRSSVDATWQAYSSGDGRVSALQILGLMVLERYLGAHRLLV
jgi:asparagine synthase (glutamine-hydrolysing)